MDNKLVSICVITFNSSSTIIETLESIYNQTYSPIELIISDDKSTDNTVDLVNNWLQEKNSRFQNTKLITSEKNTGVTGNVNRACKAASGYYVKDIAGDDSLLPDYTSICVDYFNTNINCDILFTKLKHIDENNIEIELNDDYSFFSLDINEQFKFIIEHGLPSIPTPSVIYRKDLLERMNYFDDRIPMWEDGPFYFKLLEQKVKLTILNNCLVINKLLNNSISHEMSPRHKKSIALFYFLYVRKYNTKLIHRFKNTIKFSLFYFSNIKIINKILNIRLGVK